MAPRARTVIIADEAGFCWGVRRALRLADELLAERTGPAVTLGPLIHNPRVVADLAARGLASARRADEVDAGVVLVRAHGLPVAEHRALAARGVRVVDGTCPFVRRTQERVQAIGDAGLTLVIFGAPDHPETIGLRGHARGPAFVAATPADVALLPPDAEVGAVVQSTIIEAQVAPLAAAVAARVRRFTLFPTYCDVVQRGQEAARRLARRADVVIVFGGRESSNTRKLVELCRAEGTPVHQCERVEDLDELALPAAGVIGLTAGTSTPPEDLDAARRRLAAVPVPDPA